MRFAFPWEEVPEGQRGYNPETVFLLGEMYQSDKGIPTDVMS
jgi:hypothetical protein